MYMCVCVTINAGMWLFSHLSPDRCNKQRAVYRHAFTGIDWSYETPRLAGCQRCKPFFEVTSKLNLGATTAVATLCLQHFRSHRFSTVYTHIFVTSTLADFLHPDMYNMQGGMLALLFIRV